MYYYKELNNGKIVALRSSSEPQSIGIEIPEEEYRQYVSKNIEIDEQTENE